MDKDYVRKQMGIAVDYGDFIIIRPKTNYRINSGVIVLKGEHPVVIDTGSASDPGILRIQKAFQKFKINPNDVKYIIITHAHQDHMMGLHILQRKLFKSSKTIVPQADAHKIQHPTSLDPEWMTGFPLMGRNRIVIAGYRLFSGPMMLLYVRSLYIHPKVDYTLPDINITSMNFQNPAVMQSLPVIRSGDIKLNIIPTLGHSQGHITMLDSHKNLFLADFVPFTPWIDPNAEALDNMMLSIKSILSLSESQVKRAVRNHGDIRRYPEYNRKLSDNGPWYSKNTSTWEVAEWSEEKARFKFWLEVIEHSLEKIPTYLKTNSLNVFEISSRLIPHYARYNILMRLFFIPPSITWTMAYCLKLEQMGIVKRIMKNNMAYWSL